MMTLLNAGCMITPLMTGDVPTQWKVMILPCGVSSFVKVLYGIELDFDRTGNFLVSCGEDKNWMIWEIQDENFENKGMISGLHSRSIYSCSWAKAPVQPLTEPL